MTIDSYDSKSLLPVKGIKVAACTAGIYENNRLDLALIQLPENSGCSAVFTQNSFCAAPVEVARSHIASTTPRYCLINAGNANAGMGKQGIRDALVLCEYISSLTGCSVNEILPFSTGVIGEPLPVEKIKNVIPELVNSLTEDSWIDVANSIMTTDTRPKTVSRIINFNGHEITITGIAKGSGMIRPNMATMLAFIATDAVIDQKLIDILLKEIVKISFNQITVDGETSTNDACLLMATGESIAPEISPGSIHFEKFKRELTEVCVYLAQEIVRDGEGATKFITVQVCEGKNEEECKLVAYSVSNSPLVKTAFYASDANWGRILAAVGNAGIHDLSISNVSIYIDNLCIVKEGKRADDYEETQAQGVMGQDEITIRVNLNRGSAQSTIWTCDLSHDYVRINAEYRT